MGAQARDETEKNKNFNNSLELVGLFKRWISEIRVIERIMSH